MIHFPLKVSTVILCLHILETYSDQEEKGRITKETTVPEIVVWSVEEQVSSVVRGVLCTLYSVINSVHCTDIMFYRLSHLVSKMTHKFRSRFLLCAKL